MPGQNRYAHRAGIEDFAPNSFSSSLLMLKARGMGRVLEPTGWCGVPAGLAGWREMVRLKGRCDAPVGELGV